MQYFFYFLMVIFTTLSHSSWGQQSVVTAGGDVDGAQGSLAYSIGQIFQNSLGQGNFQEGVQQPFEIYPVTSNRNRMPPLSLQIFPNPTQEWVVLRREETSPSPLQVLLSDLQGRHLLSQPWENNELTLDFGHLPPGIYLLTLDKQGFFMGSYKIIKN
jgi:hypothetical protein